MKWELSEIKVGDIVRVNMGMYYHYGICTAEDRIVQFGLPVININSNDVKVCVTDINSFLCGKFAEVMVLDKKELKKANNVETIIEKAESSIGETGYNILHNNCEHFVNRCVFNSSDSSQVADVKQKMFELINEKNIYVAPVEMFLNNDVLPQYTQQELRKITNKSLIDQKKAAYGLLKYAVEKSFNIKDDFKNLKKTKNGKPISKDYNFSISHTQDLVAVTVSKCNAGIDIEKIDETKDLSLLVKSVNSQEENLKIDNATDFYSIWTKKEAIFKFKDGKIFNPKHINIEEINTKAFEFTYKKSKYILNIATNNVSNVKLTKLFD